MTGRNTKTVVIVLGAVVALFGVVLLFGAIAPLTEHRDADGFYMSAPSTFARPSHAIVTGDIDILRGRYETVIESSVVLAFVADPDDVRMQGTASGPNELFMGIAPTTAVDEYLDGVAHDEITGWEADRGDIVDVEYTTHQGTVPPNAPGTETFWVTSVSGTGTQTIDWTIESGDWTAVIMNADASAGVTTELAFGAAPSNITAIAWTTLVVGLIGLIGGGLLLYRGLRRQDRDSTPLPIDSRNEQSAQQTETPLERTAPRS